MGPMRLPSKGMPFVYHIIHEEGIKTWFLFTNHIGIEGNKEFTDAIWVYWSQDLNQWKWWLNGIISLVVSIFGLTGNFVSEP